MNTEKTQLKAAFEELRRRILTAEIPAGNRVGEEEWAHKLGVSRGAIRESLSRLLGEGLVRPGERRGYFVRDITEEDMREIKELREMLETSAFKLACKRVTSKELKEIAGTCKDFSEFVAKSYFTAAGEADLKFHRLLIKASGNSRLIQIYENSNIPLFHQKLGRAVQANDYLETEKEHQGIFEALSARNEAKGVALLKKHFARGETIMLNQ